MPRNMSYFHTQEQMRNRTKFVTRRMGWLFLKPGDIVNSVVKAMGLKKGERIERIVQIWIRNNRREPIDLQHVTPRECELEGFPDMRPREFVEFFCDMNKCLVGTIISRIHFKFPALPCSDFEYMNWTCPHCGETCDPTSSEWRWDGLNWQHIHEPPFHNLHAVFEKRYKT